MQFKAQLTFLLLIVLITQATAQPFTWTQVSSSNQPRFEGLSAVVNDKMYVFTGSKFTGQFEHQPVSEVYNPALDLWTIISPIPIPVTHQGVLIVGLDVWLIGGYRSNGQVINNVQIYKTVTDTWIMGPPLPANRGAGAVGLVNQKIHFFAGVLPDRNTGSTDHFVLNLNDQSAGWSNATPMPIPRNHLSGAVIDNKIYAVGGQLNHDGPVQRIDLDKFHVYNPATDIWTELGNLPAPRSHFEPGTFVHNGKLYAVGGKSVNASGMTDITEYNPITDTWKKIGDLPVPLFGPAAKVINGMLIVANGGLDLAQNPQIKTYTSPFITDIPPIPETPLIIITNPLDSSTFNAPTNILITAEATNFDANPSFLKVTNPSASWRKLKLGYNTSNLWNPKWDVTASGNNQLEITLRDFSGNAEWNKIQIRPQGNSSNPLVLASYVNAVGGIGDEWKKITIPLADFTSVAQFLQLSFFEFPYCTGASAFEIGVSQIKFTGGATPFIWFDENKTDNIHDGDGGTGKLTVEFITGTNSSGAISHVGFFEGTNLLGSDSIFPYNFNWTNIAAGTYDLTATATNDNDSTIISKTVTVTIENILNIDCNGDTLGNAMLDDCEICSDGNSGHLANADKDECGVCFGNNNDKDCNGDCFGTAFIDSCETCVGGNTELTACQTDCNGDSGGSATLDDCEICSGGNSGHLANADKDECAICFGNNDDKDCNGDCFGTASIDNCEICAGGNTGITPNDCMVDCDLYVENIMLVEAGTSNDIMILANGAIINLALVGDINLRAQLCSDPVGSVKFELNNQVKIENITPYAFAGDNSGIYKKWNAAIGLYTLTTTAYAGRSESGAAGTPKTINFTIVDNASDCNGDVGGSAFFDDCGICSEGNSGHLPNSDKDNCGVCFGDNSTCCQINNDCDDGNPCTTDECDNGICFNAPISDCCQDNGDCDDGNPCTIDICDVDLGCVHTPVAGSEPSFLNIVNTQRSWRKLKLGYDNNNIWINAQDVVASGNNQLCITLRELTGTVDWNNIEFRLQGKTPGAIIGDYLPLSGISNNWTEICIPLSVFVNANLNNISYIDAPYSNGASAFEIDIQKIKFSGGSSPLLWFGEPKTDNAHDGQSGSGSALMAELIAGSPCGSSSKTSRSNSISTTKASFTIYPNPAKESITIRLNELQGEGFLIQIVSLSGKILNEFTQNTVSSTLSINHLHSGIYFIRIKGAVGVYQKRLVVAK